MITPKGVVESEPIKFNMDNLVERTNEDNEDAEADQEEEHPFCIRMAIDMGDGLSREFAFERAVMEEADTEKKTTTTEEVFEKTTINQTDLPYTPKIEDHPLLSKYESKYEFESSYKYEKKSG